MMLFGKQLCHLLCLILHEFHRLLENLWLDVTNDRVVGKLKLASLPKQRRFKHLLIYDLGLFATGTLALHATQLSLLFIGHVSTMVQDPIHAILVRGLTIQI